MNIDPDISLLLISAILILITQIVSWEQDKFQRLLRVRVDETGSIDERCSDNKISVSNRRSNSMAIDPVCKMEVDENSAAGISEYNGKKYYFCALGCKVSFDKDPEKYLGGDGGGDHHHHEHH